MRTIFKMSWRSIRSFIGRYIAILLIVGLSAGFFAGLKITTDTMRNTGDIYLKDHNFYDFRLMSTQGFTDEDLGKLSKIDGLKDIESAYSLDILFDIENDSKPLKLMSITDKINKVALIEGRMPEKSDECLADSNRFTKEDIGTKIVISEENDEKSSKMIKHKELTIVGLADSPLYIGFDRGTTAIGSGAIHSFLYLRKDAFNAPRFTEICITLNESAPIYSEEYDEIIDRKKEQISSLLSSVVFERYESDLEAFGGNKELAESFGITEPDFYALTRNENGCYVSFENDTAIIGGVANIFPIFFIFISLLVCITTMTRMVDEERTQIGVLKAMGFGNGAIVSKYLIYAGSATFIGWAIGFFSCTWGLPRIFWFAYKPLYSFAPLEYLFSPSLAILTLTVSLAAILGATYLSCRKELSCAPALLIRPRPAKDGKRILLERISPLWKRFSFLQKIITRNMFRYKKRLIMMIIGISCCGALVVTAFGARDSMVNIGDLQYDNVQTYDIEASFDTKDEAELLTKIDDIEGVKDFMLTSVSKVDLKSEKTLSSVNMISFNDINSLRNFWNPKNDDDVIPFPNSGEAVINNKIAESLNLSVGDTLTIRNADMKAATVKVSGIFDNYVFNYIFINESTYESAFGEYKANTAYIKLDENSDSEMTARRLTSIDEIGTITQLQYNKNMVTDALDSLNYIIWILVLFSGALEFIVIFNLTNINIAERSREIATVEVLGFTSKETNSYVLRENIILSIISSLLGLPLGILFHYAVMRLVVVDSFAFNIYISPLSFVLSIIFTILFAVIVNLFMTRQIKKIHMAESLKAVE